MFWIYKIRYDNYYHDSNDTENGKKQFNFSNELHFDTTSNFIIKNS